MLYAMLCYNSDAVVSSWTKQEDDAVMARLDVVHRRLAAEGKFGRRSACRCRASRKPCGKAAIPHW